MSVIVRAVVAAEDFALAETLATAPGIEVECEDVVAAGSEVVMPMLWIQGPDGDTVRDALENDPTVERVELVDEFDGVWLYRLEWVEQVGFVLHVLLNAQAVLLAASGSGDQWTLRLLYPDRETVTRTTAFCENHDIDFTVDAIREMTRASRGRSALTEEQYEALVAARKRGYFDVPRQVCLQPLAESLGISHQALSERLRRGTRVLVDELLRTGTAADAPEQMQPTGIDADSPGPESGEASR